MGIAKRKDRAATKPDNDHLGVKFKPSIDGVREEIADHGHGDNVTLLEILVRAKLVTYREESGCDKKDEDVPEEVMPAKSVTWKPHPEILPQRKAQKQNIGPLIQSQEYDK